MFTPPRSTSCNLASVTASSTNPSGSICKPRKNKKKQNKRNCKTHAGTSCCWARVCNFLFSGGFCCYFWSKTKKIPRENKQNKKHKNCKTHVGTSCWRVRVCIFLFFLFSRGVCYFWSKPQKIEKTKKKQIIARPM